MFPEIEEVAFYKIWTLGIGNGFANLNGEAFTEMLADLIIMVIVVVLDCILKISSTETKLPVKVSRDYEIQLYGALHSLIPST